MKTNINKIVIFIFCLATTLFSCKVKKPIQKVVAPLIKKEVAIVLPPSKTLHRKVVRGNKPTGNLIKIERVYYGTTDKAEKLLDEISVATPQNLSNATKYPKATFYPMGKFTIDEDKIDEAIEIFKPLVDEILASVIDNKIHAEIIINGYTDNSPFSTKSKTYIAMCNFIEKESLTKQEFTNQLSFQRALAVSDIITTILEDRMEGFDKLTEVKIDIITEGKGAELPVATRKYKQNDDRRRIAKIYYNIL
jgi:outer membrane protein OmpA-like peptidoglycan-associated protein